MRPRTFALADLWMVLRWTDLARDTGHQKPEIRAAATWAKRTRLLHPTRAELTQRGNKALRTIARRLTAKR